jgi:hypothetical protein
VHAGYGQPRSSCRTRACAASSASGTKRQSSASGRSARRRAGYRARQQLFSARRDRHLELRR